ncbi:PREDICTED: uncharacterized protein LOC109177450 isoform X2 [Ipomoea nil]|uniref:uncharacterized protein LOC109177450 isoform X2 n=1 Tax=Ipomoea nil TaxID=35883 RepID=UPI0009018466|nr:PREDICTED: uncharacterized protein LOC109177450 isoform X2 [Ipomoea nil]
MAAIVKYGPIIDLSDASAYIDAYVQLLVFVHRSTPIQYKILTKSGGREVIRTDVLVGDDKRTYFPVSIWHNQIASQIVSGTVVLLQNVDDVTGGCQVSTSAKNKFQKVIRWLQKSENVYVNDGLNHYQSKQLKLNWKVHKEPKCHDCFSLNELCLLFDSCEASFYASIGEIFLPITCRNLHESETETLFISRRLFMLEDNNLIDDLVGIGCHLCGTPLNQDHGSTMTEASQFYCQKSSNHLHVVRHIYRPFMLYVWDDSRYISLLVRNKAAELLFGNIKAEEVYACYQRQKNCKTLDNPNTKPHSSGTGSKVHDVGVKPNLYRIWLILLKTLLQKEKNSLLKFKVHIDANRDWESGKFEMVSVSLPSFN